MADKIFVSHRGRGDSPRVRRLIDDLRPQFEPNLFHLVTTYPPGNPPEILRRQVSEAGAVLAIVDGPQGQASTRNDPLFMRELDLAIELSKPIIFASIGSVNEMLPIALSDLARLPSPQTGVYIRPESWMADVQTLRERLHELIIAAGRSNRSPELPTPPAIPPQAYGPRFKLRDDGVIAAAPPEELDTAGNDGTFLSKMHPELRELSSDLVNFLRRGNVPHGHLLAIAQKYFKEVDKPTYQEIDFARLTFAGIRLANAEQAVRHDEDLPPLKADAQEIVKSLLGLHGPFVMASREGMLALAAEERYGRTPQQEREYQKAAQEFAEALQNHPEIIDAPVAEMALDAAKEIGKGANPDRSGAVATGVFKNLAVVLSSAASLGAFVTVAQLWPTTAVLAAGMGLLSNESIKASRPFIELKKTLTEYIDSAAATDFSAKLRNYQNVFKPALGLFKRVENNLRGIAAGPEELKWLTKSVDWIQQLEASRKENARTEAKLGSAPNERDKAPPPLT